MIKTYIYFKTLCFHFACGSCFTGEGKDGLAVRGEGEVGLISNLYYDGQNAEALWQQRRIPYECMAVWKITENSRKASKKSGSGGEP